MISEKSIVKLISLSGLVLAASALPSGAGASDSEIPNHPMLSDKFFISAGALWTKSNSQVRLNSGAVGIGTFLDMEDDAGLDDNDVVGQFMFRMRFFERWRLEVEYFKLDREHTKNISRTIDFGNLSFPVNTSINSAFSFEDTRVAVGYSFFKTRDKEIGVALGAHVTRLEASLSSPAIGGETGDTTAPLPVFSVYAQVALTNRWSMQAHLDRLSLDTGETNGSISSTGIEFVFQPWRHVNFGIGYRDISINISSTSEDWRGDVSVQHSGPILFIGTTF